MVLTTPYGPTKPYGSTWYISKNETGNICLSLFSLSYMIRTWAESNHRFSLLTARLFLIISGVGRFSIWGWGWGRGQTLVLTQFNGGAIGGQKPFQNYWGGGLPGPYSPTPLLLRLCYMYLYALKSVLKGSPFLVHRTDRPTTAP